MNQHDVNEIRTARAAQLAKAPDERPDLLISLTIVDIRWAIQFDNEMRPVVSDQLMIMYRVPAKTRDTYERIRQEPDYGLRLFAKIKELRFYSGGVIPLSEPTSVSVAEIIEPDKTHYLILAVKYRIGETSNPLLKEVRDAFHTYLVS